MSICRLSDVDAGYRQELPVFTGLTLSIDSGLTLLTGPNGSGKSTMVELVAGSLRPRRGRVEVFGEPAVHPALRQRRRVCRSAPALYPVLTVAEHLDLVVGLRSGDEVAMRKQANQRLAAYGATEWLDTPVSALSTGNLRKVWIVVSTLGSLELVVLDEPFNGLDPEGTAVLVTEIASWRQAGIAVLLVAHQPPAASLGLVDEEIQLPHPWKGAQL